MNSLFLALTTLLCIVVIAQPQTCTWTAWGAWSTCSDNCGNCGTQQRTRTCSQASATCTCSGDSSQQQACSPAVCKFPRTACCIGSPSSVNGMFECA